MKARTDIRLKRAAINCFFFFQRPIQNFPDYLRYVARKSKAGFDKVHEEIYKIYYGTLDRSYSESDLDMKGTGTGKTGRRSRWANSVKTGSLLWSSTGSVKPQTTFTSYISEETEEDLADLSDSNPKPPNSASQLDKTKKEFDLDKFRYSTSLEESTDYQIPNTWVSENNKKSNLKNDDGYLSMNANVYVPNPASKSATDSTDAVANLFSRVAKTSGNTCVITGDGNTGDYMNAPRKPARSVLGPVLEPVTSKDQESGRVNKPETKQQRQGTDTKHLPSRQKTEPLPSPPELPEENVYVAPNPPVPIAEAFESDYMNSPVWQPRSPGSSRDVFDDDDSDIYKVPPLNHPEFSTTHAEGIKSLEKSTSNPELCNPEDDVYQVPPQPRRLHTIDIPESAEDEDFYQVPPPSVRPVLHRVPVPKPRLSLLNQRPQTSADLYDIPPARVQLATRHNTASSPSERDDTDATKKQREEFYKLSVEEVIECLSNCSLTRLAKVCEEKQLNGEHFRNITSDDLKEEPYEMNWFYISKFFRVLDGWRPKKK